MPDYRYRIAGKIIELQSNVPLAEDDATILFRSDAAESVSVWCRVEERKALPKPEGKLLHEVLDTRMYAAEETIFLETVNQKDGEPMMLSRFSLHADNPVMLWTAEYGAPNSRTPRTIWSAIDLPWQLLRCGRCVLHSAAIEHEGQAVLFLGVSGAGKSTQAALWQKYRGAIIRNGDKTAVSCTDGRSTAWGVPFCGTSGICSDFCLPLRALVLVEKAEENRVQRLRGAQALAGVLPNCFGHRAVPGCSAHIFSLMTELLDMVPVYVLYCTPDARAVDALAHALERGT